MNILDYVNPYRPHSNQGQAEHRVVFIPEGVTEFPIPKNKIIILGVPEQRLVCEDTDTSPDAVRQAFYKLYARYNANLVYDIGDFKLGETIQDTYIGLALLIEALQQQHNTVVLLGGSQDVFYGAYLATNEQELNITGIMPTLQFPSGKAGVNPLNEIFTKEEAQRILFSNIGHQRYLEPDEDWELYKELAYSHVRLGEARMDKLRFCEPILRDSHLISLSMNAIKSADAPAALYCQPNGFAAEEICQLAYYAGIGGLSNLLSISDIYGNGTRVEERAALAAQILWHYLDGYNHRLIDHPDSNSRAFQRYVVYFEDMHHDLVFYRHITSERWWIEVPILQANRIGRCIACSHYDYLQATNLEIPDRWWKMYQRLN